LLSTIEKYYDIKFNALDESGKDVNDYYSVTVDQISTIHNETKVIYIQGSRFLKDTIVVTKEELIKKGYSSSEMTDLIDF
jgi:hypothetical protein